MYKARHTFRRGRKKAIAVRPAEGNCGLELYGFGEFGGGRWSMRGLVEEFDGEPYDLAPLVMFSGNKDQKLEGRNPHTFARWLRSQGECVQTHRRWANNHGSKIKAYFWSPSRKFKKAYIKEAEKYNEELDVKRSETTSSRPWF